MKYIILILLVITLAFSVSCTKEQLDAIHGAAGEVPVEEAPDAPEVCDELLEFNGIDSVKAFSHESIMLRWGNASGGCLQNGQTFVYDIYMTVVGGTQNQLIFSTSENEFLRTGLSKGTSYSFKVIAKDSFQESGTKFLSATTPWTATPIFRGLQELGTSRPISGTLREQNLATLKWNAPAPENSSGGNPAAAHFKIYSSATPQGQNFSAECVNSCAGIEWSQTLPECCTLGTESNPLSFTFNGLYRNSNIYTVVRACDVNEACELNDIERTAVSGPHPSGMVKVDYPFVKANGDPYALYIDVVEAGCTDYDPDDRRCVDGAMAEPARSGIPPYVFVRPLEAATYCSRSAVDDTSNMNLKYKRLLTYKEFLVASSWSNIDPFDFSIETGNGLYGGVETEECNSNKDDHSIIPETGSMSYLTGSDETKRCRALKNSINDLGSGAQDLVGNVAEWVSDTVSCFSTTHNSGDGYCLGNTNDVDDAIVNFGYCSGDSGGCDDPGELSNTLKRNLLIINGPTQLDEDILGTLLESGSFFGSDTSYTYAPPGPNPLNSDFLTSSYNDSTRHFDVGGSWNIGKADKENVGRFNLGLNHSPGAANDYVGFRCALEVTEADE